MSLIFTAGMNGENSFEYLLALIENQSELKEDPSAWLPWTFRATLAARSETRERAPPLGRRAAPIRAPRATPPP
jgi:hypothetical protein